MSITQLLRQAVSPADGTAGPVPASGIDRAQSPPPEPPHRIVIVGGGAGGLALAARLGDAMRDDRMVSITLVDASLTHVWKPLLHEVAAGTLRPQDGEIDYLQQARLHGFRFRLGTLDTVDRQRRKVWLSALVDEAGEEIAPRRWIGYDTLVLAIGSVVNDFGTPGVREHAVALDEAVDARRFHRRLLAACARAELVPDGPVDVVIVGGGATGVELAAELIEAVRDLARYGARLSALAQAVRLHLVEAAPRLLGGLPEDVARTVHADLLQLGVRVRLGSAVAEVARDHVLLASGENLDAELTVWAAGIHGPAVLQRLDGLELSSDGRLVVTSSLQTTRDPRVFAFGDCAYCVVRADLAPIPPRAQAAEQQARFLVRALRRRLKGRALPSFRFHDRGVLVALGRQRAVGRLSTANGRSVRLQGVLARWTYWMAQRRHLLALHGWSRTVLVTLAGWLGGRTRPRVKLH